MNVTEIDKVKVAIADDFPALIKGLKFIVDNIGGYETTIEALDGMSLIQKIREVEHKPDIIILDIGMPYMDGFTTLIHLKKEWPDIKVIMQSMYYNEFNATKSFRHKAAAFIPKEASPTEIETTLKSVTSNGYHYNSWIEKHIMPLISDESFRTNISDKEKEFLKYAPTELTYAQIASILGKSTRTVEGYRDALFEKLQIKTRTGLAIFAIESGLFSRQLID